MAKSRKQLKREAYLKIHAENISNRFATGISSFKTQGQPYGRNSNLFPRLSKKKKYSKKKGK